MRHLRYFVLLAGLLLPAAYSQAQVSIGVGIGSDYGLYNAPPVCAYGFYPDYPYGCAPYGYWGPEWFAGGVFIGAGPWYHFYYSHPGFYRPYYVNRGFGFRGREFDRDRGFREGGREFDRDRGFRGEGRAFHNNDGGRFGDGGHAFRGGDGRGGGHEFHGGGGNFHGGGGGNFHGGGGGNFHDGGGGGFHGGGGGGFHGGGGGHGGGQR
jgi:hypothetical protein